MSKADREEIVRALIKACDGCVCANCSKEVEKVLDAIIRRVKE